MDRIYLNEHDANQGAQSKGEFLGMTGNSGWYLLGSAGASIIILILFWGVFGMPLLPCLLLGVVLCALSVTYVFTLKNNKPEHYDTDFFESALIEAGLMELAFGPRTRLLANPFTAGRVELDGAAPAKAPRQTNPRHAAGAGSPSTRSASERPPVHGATSETKRKVRPTREEPVVTLAAYEHLREELDATEELLEDALVERGEI